jgi:hypothetical protein
MGLIRILCRRIFLRRDRIPQGTCHQVCLERFILFFLLLLLLRYPARQETVHVFFQMLLNAQDARKCFAFIPLVKPELEGSKGDMMHYIHYKMRTNIAKSGAVNAVRRAFINLGKVPTQLGASCGPVSAYIHITRTCVGS